MAASKAASRYAKALLDLAYEDKVVETIYADMVMLDGLCYSNRDFLAFLHSPIIQRRKKYITLDALFEGKIDKMSLGFLKLLTKNNRENILSQITESFIDQYKKSKGILEVHVSSAVALEDNVKKSINATVSKHFEGDIELHEKIDESLIGGFVVSIEDKQIDASIKNQLTNLRNLLMN